MDKTVRSGVLAAEVLKLVCTDPENAYPYGITKALNQKHGEKYTHNLEVGLTLHRLARDGVLKDEGPIRSPRSSKLRKMYSPTWKAGLYLGLMGVTA